MAAALLPHVRDLRRAGSAALDLCAVASGHLDAYFESGLNPWDLAAGWLVATEAGALVTGLRSAGPADTTIVARRRRRAPRARSSCSGLEEPDPARP